MTGTDVITLLGGLSFFLFGMRTMSDSLEKAAGARLKPLLQAVTRGKFRGMMIGAAVTAAVQSSSAVTVMTIGFVQAGLMTLGQAAGVIMGANIGTTVTSLMLSVKIDFGPAFAAAGLAFLFMPAKRPALRSVGSALVGLSIIFAGMDAMSSAARPLRELPAFRDIMAQAEHPAAGILTGALVTAVLQSSSASIGILQAMAGEGIIALPAALYIIFGQNIGTCVTAMIAAIGMSDAAKRTAVVHMLFNVIGTVLMTAAALLLPLEAWLTAWAPGNIRLQIALAHLLFNAATTAVLLPFAGKLVNLACRIIRE